MNLEDSSYVYRSWFANNFEKAKVISDFLDIKDNSPDAISFMLALVDAELSEITIDFEEEAINFLINENPLILYQIDCAQIQNWQYLTQFKPSQDVVNKIQEIDENNITLFGDFEIQYIEDAQGAVVNMDYFPINITTLPLDRSTRKRYTPQGLLEYIRTNINDFVDTNRGAFAPYDYIDTGYDEAGIWYSNNPYSALVHLHIQGEAIGGVPISNDGTVVVSDYESDSWMFSTIEAALDWTHPVSGNRQFGINNNSNGTFTIFTRGVDRVTENFDLTFAEFFGMQSPFEGGEDLWNSFQQKVNAFINSNGGASTIEPYVANRPNWDEIKEVLMGTRSIKDLDCN